MIPRTFSQDAIRRSPDLDRVLALPRRSQPGPARLAAMVGLVEERLRRPDRPPGSACGCLRDLGRRRCLDRLLPVQGWALWEAGLAGGLLGPIGVGRGKTALNILAPMVVPDCRLAALLVPPGLVEQLIAEYRAWAEHFLVPSLVVPGAGGAPDRGWFCAGRPALHVVTYSRFSRAEATDLLDRLGPDLVVADEAHCVRNRTAARTSRVMRYFAGRPGVRLCCWSGTLTARSLRDFAHLSAHALGDGSPLPVDPDEVDRWAAAVDPSDWPAPAGALRALGRSGEGVRDAVRRRVVETEGVVASSSASGAEAAIVLRERRPPPMPDSVREMVAGLRATWTRPDGEELVDALSAARCAREMACGFYYRWRFPGNPDRRDVDAWFAARKAWHRELREKLRAAAPHLDSPLLCARAAIRAYARDYVGDLPTWRAEAWPRWRDLRDSVDHVTEAVWVDRWLALDAAAWASGTRGIAWYEHDAFGRAVAEAADLPLHGGGAGAEERIRAEDGSRSVVASVRCHGSGRDGLQRLFSEQLVANPPGAGDAWEQLLGRLHRSGQEADEVVTHVYRHTPEMRDAVDRALREAKYVEGITGARQKLLAADVEWELTQWPGRGTMPETREED
jgi:hypothetical protein